MKVTFDLPEELVREVKLRAVIQRRTVKDLVAELLRQELGMAAHSHVQARPAGSRVRTGANGLPVFKCRAIAPALRMDTKQLLQLEQAALAELNLKHV